MPYPLLEHGNLLIRQRISFGNDGNQVNLGMQAAHDFNVKRFERMSCRLDEIYTCVYTVIHDVHAVDLVFGVEIGIEARFDVLDDWAPRIIIVDKVTESRGIHHGQTQADAILFNVGTDGLDGDGFWDDV